MDFPNIQKNLSARRFFSAFTLVELIVVITILAVLATVGFLSLSGFTDDARSATAKANVRTVYSAILTESTTSGNSPRFYIDHDPAAALSGAVAFVDGNPVVLTGGQWGSGGTNYSAGNPRWDRLRMNGEKFKMAFAVPGVAGFGGFADGAGAAYDTGAVTVWAFDASGKATLTGKSKPVSYFQVGGVSPSTKKAIVTGNYVASWAGSAPSLLRDPVSTNAAAPLLEPETVTVVGDDVSGRKWSDGTFATTCLQYAAPPIGKAYAGSTGSGTYVIDPDGPGGSSEIRAYCDMSTDGGGWTMIAKSVYKTGSTANGGDLFANSPDNAKGDASVFASPDTVKLSTAAINAIMGSGERKIRLNRYNLDKRWIVEYAPGQTVDFVSYKSYNIRITIPSQEGGYTSPFFLSHPHFILFTGITDNNVCTPNPTGNGRYSYGTWLPALNTWKSECNSVSDNWTPYVIWSGCAANPATCVNNGLDFTLFAR